MECRSFLGALRAGALERTPGNKGGPWDPSHLTLQRGQRPGVPGRRASRRTSTPSALERPHKNGFTLRHGSAHPQMASPWNTEALELTALGLLVGVLAPRALIEAANRAVLGSSSLGSKVLVSKRVRAGQAYLSIGSRNRFDEPPVNPPPHRAGWIADLHPAPLAS